jgi:ribosomal protein S18 acetylase RimI-like enzyme
MSEIALPNVQTKNNLEPFLAHEEVRIVSMTRDMIPQVAKIHFEAFAGYMNTRLGSSYIEAFLAWFLTSHAATALVAVDRKSNVIGYVLGAPIDYGPSMNHDLLFTAARSVIIRPWLFFSRTFWIVIAARIRSMFNMAAAHEPSFRYPEPAMSLIAIGVASSARGQKVGVRLLRGFEHKAHELGVQSLQLTVYPKNIVARRLYESNGWKPMQSADDHAVEYFRILAEEGNEQPVG